MTSIFFIVLCSPACILSRVKTYHKTTDKRRRRIINIILILKKCTSQIITMTKVNKVNLQITKKHRLITIRNQNSFTHLILYHDLYVWSLWFSPCSISRTNIVIIRFAISRFRLYPHFSIEI